MKNKNSIYILLPVVLLIWGGVMYEFFSFLDTDDTSVMQADAFDIKPLKLKARDILSIDVNYRDPFLGKMYSSAKKNIAKRHTVAKPAEKIIWPQIIFKGVVSDTKDKRNIFMVIINGKTFLMKKGDVEGEVLLKSGNRQSIEVAYKHAVNKIELQN